MSRYEVWVLDPKTSSVKPVDGETYGDRRGADLAVKRLNSPEPDSPIHLVYDRQTSEMTLNVVPHAFTLTTAKNVDSGDSFATHSPDNDE